MCAGVLALRGAGNPTHKPTVEIKKPTARVGFLYQPAQLWARSARVPRVSDKAVACNFSYSKGKATNAAQGAWRPRPLGECQTFKVLTLRTQ